jgi:hypothetical protein
MNWTLVSVTNDQAILESCLLSSPELPPAGQIILQRGYRSISDAYNDAMDRATSDIVVFAHQDVYLPAGWVAAVEKTLQELSEKDPDWGVLGVWGVRRDGTRGGYLYCTGSAVTYGRPSDHVVEVRSLDEVLLIMRKSARLRFDPALRGFHLYGTDICLEANRSGRRNYAISAFCIHNTNGYALLPFQFWRNCLFIRNKWKRELPILAPCANITFWGWPMLRHNLATLFRYYFLGQRKVNQRVADPSRLYRDLFVSLP